MKGRLSVLWAGITIAALAAACGGQGPTAASGGGVALQGMLLSEGASASAADVRSAAASHVSKVTVRVEGTSLTVDVNANGTFKLEGIPSGTFTLVFLADGVEVGRVQVSAGDGSEVKIVVQVKNGALVVIELEIDDAASGGASPSPAPSGGCDINGGTVGRGIELEGNVSSGTFPTFEMSVNGRSGLPIRISASSAKVSCIGSAKAASDAECKAQIKTGAKVHVKGTLMTCSASTSAEVTATEVKVQKE